ncbi:hypothetical protein UO65_2310 [Actinokineospora spheciospongiae]|uniref:Galactosyltransferase C-terminal domain-containing protein n=1 Tax=Actinokineospora spheciospongiae TaxID=909613 RepID=W7IPJ6_9PSEU|nr:hypothetical protein UO65_2310 [Actinokineospora spheciospongiae]
MVSRTAVVTITRGRAGHLALQCRGLAADPPDLHVVVGMGERPEPPVVPGCEQVVVVLPDHGGPLPLAAARNRGADEALGAGAEVLVFLDVDCIPGPRAVSRYREAVSAATGPALFCGPVAYLPPPPPEGYPATGLAALAPPHPGRPAPDDGVLLRDDRFELFWSLSFGVSAESWRSWGGFHEGYRGYGAEDTDFALTAAAAGARLYWLGGADAHHQYHPPTRETPARAAEMVHNSHLFRRRHGYWPMRDWLHDLARDGLVDFDPDADVLRLRG